MRLRLLRCALLLLGLSAAGLGHAACESGLAERMHAKLHPNRPLDERLAACKPWPAFPGRSIVVLPVPRETSSTGAKVFDLELLLIQRPDNGNTERDTVIGRIFQPEALDEDAATAIQDIRIDTSRYVLSSDTRAFGLRVRYRGTAPGSTVASETIRLYVHHGSKLREVLQEVELDHDSGEWDSSCTGRFEQLRTMLSVGKSASNGYADLQLSRTLVQSRAQMQEDQSCTEKAMPARFNTVTLRYDGERYRVPKSLRQQPP
ncbi:hypothetical protein [Variovorax paradoxus]|jgi:hypothetical protein|uniref:Lipoprotein n=1 Tax=Variovorax paradoxus TaxID=34073 RepID=A0AAW8ERU9_VARPD|nr:hypothetical protein [Variovorax paradoxus]MDP9975149.1 hypothetical protein [Variovorax paradoxus]